MSQLANVNWISIALAFIVYFVLGDLWFRMLFPKPYKISLDRAEDEVLPNKPIFILGPAICALMITIATAVLLYALNISSYVDALEFALFIGCGYLVANTLNIAINPNILRPILYGIISGSCHLAGILIVSIILVAMK